MGTIWREGPLALGAPAPSLPEIHRAGPGNGLGQPRRPLWRGEGGKAPCTLLAAGNPILQRQAELRGLPWAIPDVPSPSICPRVRQEGGRGCRKL